MADFEAGVRAEDVDVAPVLSLDQEDHRLAGGEALQAVNAAAADLGLAQALQQHFRGGIRAHAAADLGADPLLGKVDRHVGRAAAGLGGHLRQGEQLPLRGQSLHRPADRIGHQDSRTSHVCHG